MGEEIGSARVVINRSSRKSPSWAYESTRAKAHYLDPRNPVRMKAGLIRAEPVDMTASKQHAHLLIEQLPEEQLTAAVRFLECLLQPADPLAASTSAEDEEISDAEEAAVARSKAWFQNHKGIPFEQIVAECGFTMEQIRGAAQDPVD
jgi:hypothetical protein